MSDPNCLKCLGCGWYPISLEEPWLKRLCSCVIDTEIAAVKETMRRLAVLRDEEV